MLKVTIQKLTDKLSSAFKDFRISPLSKPSLRLDYLGSELIVSARAGDVSGIRHLLLMGADIDFRDYSGATPLHVAAREGRALAVEALIEQGANIDALDSMHRTPLICACWSNVSVVERLLAAGASTDACDFEGGTPLIWAAMLDRSDIGEVLVRYGAGIESLADSHSRFYQKMFPVHEAVLLKRLRESRGVSTHQSGPEPMGL